MHSLSYAIQKSEPDQFLNLIEKDELLICISPSDKLGNVSQKLIKTEAAQFSRQIHYLMVHAGILSHSQAIFLCPEFKKKGQNHLEERWVCHEWAKTLQSVYSPRKLAIYLDEGCSSPELARLEDLLSIYMSADYNKSKWKSIRIASKDPDSVTRDDPYYSTRFAFQIAYRSWINENPDSLTSIAMGQRLKDFAQKKNLSFRTLDETDLLKENMNLLLAVGQGAKKSPSRLHLVESNLRPGVKPLVLVGKGITFDSGGINLKPHESFVNCMKNDMGGAGLFANLFMGLIESGFSEPVVLVIPCCENAIDADSMKPGVVIESRSGKSVIIEHTDAEGRLILADAMHYAFEKYQPKHLLTAATLTTASLRQFGNYFTPVHFATPDFESRLRNSSKLMSEEFTFWGEFLPFLQGNKSNAADLTNMGRLASHASIGSGSNVAAHFLKEFASGPYTHLDIFNTVWNWTGDYPGAHYGATGSVFNSLWHCLRTSEPA
ncbi:MAG: M17 family metallopeptidase [Proteobacteria bacterium]|nr:M17 family metallopeptidase [Pseudomonadota bacterium]